MNITRKSRLRFVVVDLEMTSLGLHKVEEEVTDPQKPRASLRGIWQMLVVIL